MGTTKIEWTEATWNPFAGCSHASIGCKNCYAERMAARQRAMGTKGYGNVVDTNGRWTGNVVFRPNQLEKPLHWKKPRMIFVCSMCDLFHPEVDTRDIDSVFEIMAACPQHTFQILTKRPELIEKKLYGVTEHNPCRSLGGGDYLPNVWLGVTAEDQLNLNKRILDLLYISWGIRFLSLEPLLGPIEIAEGGFSGRWGIDWVIVGPETGPGRRECKIEWIHRVVDDCAAAGVPCFVKAFPIGNRISKNMDEWPKWARVRQYPEEVGRDALHKR